MINIEHLDKTYHLKNADVHAVDDVSLHIESGQIYGVIGYSGAGKKYFGSMLELFRDSRFWKY